MSDKIEKMYAYFMTNPETDQEGIAGVITPQGGRPLCAVDEETLAEIKPLAQDFANATGVSTQLVEFSSRRNIETVNPQENAAPSERMTQVPEGDPSYTPKLEDFEPEKSPPEESEK